jgi:hypothetical protein
MIMMSDSTALLFDHNKQMARFVSYDGEWHTLKEMLGVDLVDTIRLDDDHILFVDDEGLINGTKIGFEIEYKGNKVRFAGSGLLTGDSYGQNAPITLNLHKLKISVLRLSYEDA